MTSISRILIMGCMVFGLSCSSDDDGPSFDFKDQNAQGRANGKTWVFKSGKSLDSSGGKITIDLSAEATDDACKVIAFSGIHIFFTVEKKTGVTELSLSSGQSASIQDPDEGKLGTVIVVTEGAIEIVSVSETQIKGKLILKAGKDDTSLINGNFTVPICKL